MKSDTQIKRFVFYCGNGISDEKELALNLYRRKQFEKSLLVIESVLNQAQSESDKIFCWQLKAKIHQTQKEYSQEGKAWHQAAMIVEEKLGTKQQ